MTKDLEESSTLISCLYNQTPFVRFWFCFRSDHLWTTVPYRPILKAYIRRSWNFIHSINVDPDRIYVQCLSCLVTYD